MANKPIPPTLEKYTEVVKELCKNDYPEIYKLRLKDYLETEEAAEVIKNDYDNYCMELEKGMEEKYFLGACASATEYNLYMLS